MPLYSSMISLPSSMMPMMASQVLPCGVLLDRLEHLFQRVNLAFGLDRCFSKAALSSFALRRLCHLRQGARIFFSAK